jgi:N-acetylglutamate synthase-like GNAT family acetyltransferase
VNPVPEPQHDLPPHQIGALEERLYEFNRKVTGRGDGAGLAFVLHDDAGRMIGAAAGYSWASIGELRQMWVEESLRGRGFGRALLEAFIAEAARRGVKRIWVASYDFQAPGLYERLGFVRMAEFEGWPDGHSNVILCKTISQA